MRVVNLLYTGLAWGPPLPRLPGVGEEAAEAADFKPFPKGHHHGNAAGVELEATDVIVTVEA